MGGFNVVNPSASISAISWDADLKVPGGKKICGATASAAGDTIAKTESFRTQVAGTYMCNIFVTRAGTYRVKFHNYRPIAAGDTISVMKNEVPFWNNAGAGIEGNTITVCGDVAADLNDIFSCRMTPITGDSGRIFTVILCNADGQAV
ncbi:MAG: hypothetical protein OS112_03275 [Methanoregula sp.]|nr:MAG: hypothetical protein OS112_03275 [Methanoregula sp.]